jgi:trimeric autotransporter adhesin
MGMPRVAPRGACLLAAWLLLGPAGLQAQVLPLAPKLTASADIKEIELSWSHVPGSTRYVVWESPDGIAPFVPLRIMLAPPLSSPTSLTFSQSVAVHRHHWQNARYYVQACDGDGCIASAERGVEELELDAIGYFKARNSEAGDGLGHSVALSADGRTLVVGAPYEDGSGTGVDPRVDEAASQAGAVYVFARSGRYWRQEAYIKAPDTAAGDCFGMSLALSGDGNTLVVGAPLEIHQSAYVYRRAGSNWRYESTLHPSNGSLGDNFGAALALSADGHTLAVAAPGEDSGERGVGGKGIDNSASGSGAVYVFSLPAQVTDWQQVAYIKGSNSDALDAFGTSIALSADGSVLAVGSELDDSYVDGTHAASSLCLVPVVPADVACDTGAVDVYSRTAGSWRHEAYLRPAVFDADDRFGTAVALSGDGLRLAAGASGEDGSAAGIDGDATDNGAPESGAAYVFARASNGWQQEAYVKASSPGANDLFGGAIALDDDGSTLAISARREDGSAEGVSGSANDALTDAGAAYIFENAAPSGWSERRYVKAAYPGANDHFGGDFFHAAIALNSDGSALAVPAPDEDGSGAGVGARPDDAAPDAGAVYLY